MESLSNEVQLLILRYIDTKRDLKSLCLTSKHLRTLSLPRLYHTVYLRTGEEGLGKFFKCIAAGAGYHLRHIRSLSFEDELCDPGDDAPPPNHLHLVSAADARDVLMHLLISMLPKNQLHAFRFIARRSLRKDIFHLLNSSQRELQHLQLRCLEPVSIDLTSFRAGGEGHDHNVHESADSESRLLKLPHLKLYNVDADEIWCCLAATIDFSNVKTLALFDCENATFYDKFLSSLNGRTPALEHVYATINLRDTISDFLYCCENLTSLHLVWRCAINLDKFWRMIEHRGPGLKSLGVQHRYDVTLFSHWNGQLSRLLSKCQNAEHLRLPLSIDAIRSNAWEAHEDEDEDGEENEDEDGEEDEDEGGEEDEDEDEWEDEDEEEDEDEGEEDEDPFKDEDVEEFMDSFEQMTQLRSVLFTYDPHIFESDTYRNESELQPMKFASDFFKYVAGHGWCPSLDVLVTGVPVDLEDIEDDPHGRAHRLEYETPYPWQCFVKGYRYQFPGHTGSTFKDAIAIRVPAHVLRSYQPGYNMPDIIPRAYWMDSTLGESWGFLADRNI